MLAACGSSGSGNSNQFQASQKAALTITTTSLPDGLVSQSYTAHLQASGGSGTFSWKVASGSLPAGLSLSSAGDLTGTPTAVATSSFAVEVDDTAGASSSANFGIRVNGAIMPVALADAVMGEVYNGQLKATGGVAPYTWSAQNVAATQLALPDGLSMSSSGAVSGIPAAAGLKQLLVTISDSSLPPQSVPAVVTLNVKQPPLRIVTTALPSARIDAPYFAQLAVIGAGDNPTTFSLTGGALPQGLAMDPSGAIAGTPTATGNFTWNVHASGAAGSANAKVQMNVVTAADRNDSIATATPLSNGTFSASISPYIDSKTGIANPDTDYFKLQAQGGATVTVEITAKRLKSPSPLDSVIEIVDASGTRLHTCNNTEDDDATLPIVVDATPLGYDDECINDDIETGVIQDSKLTIRVPGALGSQTSFYVHVLDFSGSARPDMVYRISISGAR